jgi:hypothetical protein
MTSAMSTTTNHQPAKDRPTFTITLRPEPGVDAVPALRAVLKTLLRRYGMKCVSAREDLSERSI